MQEQPIPPQPQAPHPYEFILNTSAPPKKHIIPSGNSKRERIIIAVIFAVVLLVVLFIVMGILNSSSNSQAKELIGLAEQQTELVRVAGLGSDKAQSPSIQAYATTVDLSITTERLALLNYLKSHGHKLSDKTLTAASQNAQTDAALADADKNDQYDQVLSSTLATNLQTYQTALKKAYNGNKGKAIRELLATDYSQVSTLLSSKN